MRIPIGLLLGRLDMPLLDAAQRKIPRAVRDMCAALTADEQRRNETMNTRSEETTSHPRLEEQQSSGYSKLRVNAFKLGFSITHTPKLPPSYPSYHRRQAFATAIPASDFALKWTFPFSNGL